MSVGGAPITAVVVESAGADAVGAVGAVVAFGGSFTAGGFSVCGTTIGLSSAGSHAIALMDSVTTNGAASASFFFTHSGYHLRNGHDASTRQPWVFGWLR